ncbi:hypothetical protein NQ315_013209 [Exocentrus adspersus]|uniref:XK-related protein n=1 Tax=Exocentrus adspersus TaxID=1586481 RepID=A0AAV8VD68_9CUCU|nr:hypothetical protein NQ315_013209 [Exocentrus adspersus]
MNKVANNKSKKTLLGYELSEREDAVINYLVPSVCACLLYIFIIASDIAVIFCHYKNNNPIWGSLTIFLMYLPPLGSYIIIVSNWELWPEEEGCGMENIKWFTWKTVEHILFPVWNMWRFAERIFWSIEAVRHEDEMFISEAKSMVNAARSIELYVFLQSYMHALPQVLLQLYILMRHNTDMKRETEKAQILSLMLNLAKVSITTTYYQRFKSQKLTGKQYPWYKFYKTSQPPSSVQKSNFFLARSTVEERRISKNFERTYNTQSRISERRRSSDSYLEPSTSQENRGTKQYEETTMLREISVMTCSNEEVSNTTRTEPDFNISRIIYIKGLQEDDLAGKETMWLLGSHFAIVMVFLLYDVKSDEVKRSKAAFFLFIGLVYIFCIIEFKIKFKKSTFIYYGFFALVFTENLIVSVIWFVDKIDSIENNFWFRYSFYIVVMGSIFSFSSMLFYFNINKPPKILIETKKRDF